MLEQGHNHTTEVFSRTHRKVEGYLTIEKPDEQHNDFLVLAGVVVVVSLFSILIWRYVC